MRNGERVQIESRRDWRAWLAENHEREEGIWLARLKKHCGDKYVTYNVVVEEALCFGWIDSSMRFHLRETGHPGVDRRCQEA